MSDEDLAAFFKANPERAVEMAKIATSFQHLESWSLFLPWLTCLYPNAQVQERV